MGYSRPDADRERAIQDVKGPRSNLGRFSRCANMCSCGAISAAASDPAGPIRSEAGSAEPHAMNAERRSRATIERRYLSAPCSSRSRGRFPIATRLGFATRPGDSTPNSGRSGPAMRSRSPAAEPGRPAASTPRCTWGPGRASGTFWRLPVVPSWYPVVGRPRARGRRIRAPETARARTVTPGCAPISSVLHPVWYPLLRVLGPDASRPCCRITPIDARGYRLSHE